MKVPDFISQNLPALEPCQELTASDHDVFVHAPGFEDRTTAIFDSMSVATGSHAVLLDYRPFNEKNRLQDVRLGFEQRGVRVLESGIVPYDRFSPNDFEARLAGVFQEYGARRAIIDISTMSKLAILLTLNVCMKCELEVLIHYAEAQVYGPSLEEFESAKNKNEIHRPTIQIFTGVHGVVRVDSLSSVAMQGQPTAAIVFMSFNDALTQVLLNTVYPSRLFLVNGMPPVHSWRETATAWIHDQVRREWEQDNPMDADGKLELPQRSVSTLDYRETVSLLVNLYWELSATHRVLLAPSGSKMQAVGCFFAKVLHPDIHIEYPSPDGFLPQYSSGVAGRWKVQLGHLAQLLGRISAEERREFLEVAV